MHPKVPPRLPWLFESNPLYFVTACTSRRRHVLANKEVHDAFRSYARRAPYFEIAVGRYVLMPDHIHLFLRVSGERSLGSWMAGLKRFVSAQASLPPGSWQRGFFDHFLRSDESYSQKWESVFQNPVRAGLIDRAETWPYAGEIALIDRT